jgi:hypothetical protein
VWHLPSLAFERNQNLWKKILQILKLKIRNYSSILNTLGRPANVSF